MLSYTAQVNYRHFVNEQFFLTTALAYQQLESRLDWSEKIDNYPISLENVITERQTNALTGETGEIRGNVELEVGATRIVRHHNRHTMVQLPIGIGMVKDLGPFQWSLVAGTSLNIFGSSSGRLLLQGQIVDYGRSSNGYFQTNWKMNGYLETGLDYTLNKTWNLTALVGYQKAISNWSLENGIQMRPQMWSAQLGLRYNIR